MKLIDILKKYSYNDQVSSEWMPDSNSFFNEQSGPFNQYFPPGTIEDRDDLNDMSENHQKDGKDFEEFKQFKRLKRRNRLKRLMKLRKNKKKKNVFQPAPFYSSMYGYTGFEGAMTSPLEYYSGTIADNPDAITNPYNNTYQGASLDTERIKIRGMIFKDYIKD
jgi:hypothetical protein